MRLRAAPASVFLGVALLLGGAARAEEPANGDGAFAKTIPGVRIRFRDPLGNPAEVEGVLERERDGTLQIRSAERVHAIPRSHVLETTPVALDPRTIYAAEELLARFVATCRSAHADDPVLSSRDHWRAALYAEWLEAWEAARDHYARCAADPDFPRRVAAAGQAERIEARLREAAALAALQQAELEIRHDRFRRARASLGAFLAAHADATESAQARYGLLLKTLALRREVVLRHEVEVALPAAVRRLIREQAGRPQVAFTDVTAWARRELSEAAFAAVADGLHASDDVRPEEVLRLWGLRSTASGRRVTYGRGSFLVEPRPAGLGGASLTRDQWWAGATLREREQWILAFFVERSGLFEVERREHPPCPACRGTGLGTKTLPGAGTITFVCPSCQGLRHDVVLHYR